MNYTHVNLLFTSNREVKLQMKENIHPSYQETTVRCTCGNEMKIMSTRSDLETVEVCSDCHPFYTGSQKLVDTGGRVGRFNKRYPRAR